MYSLGMADLTVTENDHLEYFLFSSELKGV